MRTHTALHALCGVVWRDYGALVTGGNMEPGRGPDGLRVRDDVAATSSTRSRRRSTPSWPPRATCGSTSCRATRRSRSRTSSGRRSTCCRPGIEEIRTIEIVGLDLQADGGTHVANTREVGGIRVTGYESKGRINKRIRIELTAPEA